MRPSRLPHGLPFGAIVTDYDRTLTDGDLHVSYTALRLLSELQEREHVLVLIATGRNLSFVRRRRRELGQMDCIVCENGAVLWFPSRRKVVRFGDMSAARSMLIARGIPFDAGEVVVSVPRSYEDDLRRVAEALGGLVHLVSNRDSVMILPSGVDKASGVTRALSELGANSPRLVCIGDGENDASLFSLASLRVATFDAVESLKEMADYVCEAPASKGVEAFLKGLLRGTLPACRAGSEVEMK